MEVRPGYKQTDVGVIPEDWSVIPFAQAVRSYIDYRGRTPKKLGLSWGGGDILALSANNVRMGRIDPNQEAYFGSVDLYRRWMTNGACELGDVLLTMEAPLGNVAQIPDSSKYILSQRVLLIKPRDWLLRDYLAHYMKGVFFQNQLALNATGSTARGIQRRKLDQLPLYFPPTKAEQQAIAGALSDLDTLIESLEQVVAKKRQLKQGTMHELLSGKTRLPGFSGEWMMKRLGEIARTKTGSRNNQDKVEGGKYPFFVRSATVERINSFSFDCEAILIPGEGGIGRIFHYVRGCFDVHQRVYAITHFSPETSGRFVYFYMAEKFGVHAMQNSVKATVDSLRLPTFQNFEIIMPPTAKEQAAVAAILSDMDEEITSLEDKLAKTHRIKQGLMQELLTGRIRLI